MQATPAPNFGMNSGGSFCTFVAGPVAAARPVSMVLPPPQLMIASWPPSRHAFFTRSISLKLHCPPNSIRAYLIFFSSSPWSSTGPTAFFALGEARIRGFLMPSISSCSPMRSRAFGPCTYLRGLLKTFSVIIKSSHAKKFITRDDRRTLVRLGRPLRKKTASLGSH